MRPVAFVRPLPLVCLAAALLGAAACIELGEGPTPDDPGVDPNDADDPDDPGDPGDPHFDGAAIYDATCASCHGVRGEGLSAPRLDRWSLSRTALVQVIATRMPSDAPRTCPVGGCAEAVSDYILDSLHRAEGESVCAGVDVNDPGLLPPRTLRLLTKEEYRRSVTALLNLGPASCLDDDGCGLDQRCLASTCAPLPCGTTTFTWDPPGAGPSAERVHVAGSFNGWAPTLDASDAALSWDAERSLWVGRVVTGTGRHDYKLVINERDWMVDPLAQETSADGFGGQNSVRNVQCAAATDSAVLDFAAPLPNDPHPTSFPFNSHAASGVVTALHVDDYLLVAEAALSAADVDALIGCDAGPACARATVQDVGRRSFRRPLTSVEVDRYAALISAESSFREGVKVAVAALLSSPGFLYRSEIGVDEGSGVFRLDSFETASLLSFTLTGTGPSDLLLDAAAAGDLDDVEGLRDWADELLRSPAAKETLGAFAQQWLGAEKVLTVDKRPGLFPDFNDDVRRDLYAEPAAFFSSVMFEGSGRFADLLTSRSGFVSSRTAGLYGASSSSPTLESVTLPPERRGLLSMAAMLSSTAHSDQTSPILRGLFVRQTLLCQPLPPPPPNVGSVPDVDPNATTRERFTQHTANPFCASCHRTIDPVGFGFEGFDPIGRARTTENGLPIDHAGDMVDLEGIGTQTSAPFSSMADLADIMAASEVPERCFVTQAGRYTLGRELEHDEPCLFDAAASSFIASGGDLRAAFLEVVVADAFRARRSP